MTNEELEKLYINSTHAGTCKKSWFIAGAIEAEEYLTKNACKSHPDIGNDEIHRKEIERLCKTIEVINRELDVTMGMLNSGYFSYTNEEDDIEESVFIKNITSVQVRLNDENVVVVFTCDGRKHLIYRDIDPDVFTVLSKLY